MTAFKIITHDYRPPLQGGDPIWDGSTLPFTLPKVKLDTSREECAGGWNYTTSLAAAMRIAGLWRDGYPAVCFVVKPSADAIERGDKKQTAG